MEKCPSQYGVPTIRLPKRSLHPRGDGPGCVAARLGMADNSMLSHQDFPRLDMSAEPLPSPDGTLLAWQRYCPAPRGSSRQ